ncbi:MAG: class B sortase [Eubacteriales bacterium]|nr:class B sortase [Eubacteriales bacterium]
MSRWILKAANSLVSLFVALCLCLAGAYAAYALWDNSRIYASAQNVQADMVKLKPAVEEDGGASFEELMAINSDVCAWVTLDNTKIDHPVLQGSTNLTYINTDVYGNFALAGSIFLDTRNERDFSDAYSLLYGHHMENSGMFGDLDLYKDEAFFQENTTGTLILPDRAYNLEIFACLLVKAGEDEIFDPERWQDDISGLVSYVKENSLYLHGDTMEALLQSEQPQILALSTCSTEFTDARTIILAAMDTYQAAVQEGK